MEILTYPNKGKQPKLSRIYSFELKEYLLNKGYRYMLMARDLYNGKKFWAFFTSDDLMKDINGYLDARSQGNS